MKALIGTKVGMTSIISDDGKLLPVTVLQAGPVTVTQIKSADSDGYDAVQVGYGEHKNAKKPLAGHTKASKTNPRHSREFKVQDQDLGAGDLIDVSAFEPGDTVKVSGVSKGKGFAGTIKRHNFSRQPKSHGGKGHTRRPGSIGSMYPQKIFKGKRMAGRMGGVKTSVRNQTVAFVDQEKHLLGIVGIVPGPIKGIVTVEEQ